jgi:mono/diheme cytochrome c family protein
MPTRRLLLTIAGILVLVLLAGGRSNAGGWAVVTLGELPDHMVAGTPAVLTYAVRGHGTHLVPGLGGRVEAREPALGLSVSAAAHGAATGGFYEASLTLPAAGTWTMRVVTGFPTPVGGGAVVTMPVIEPGQAPPQMSDADRGGRLFVAKGCVSCHRRGPISAGPQVGPDLTERRYAPEFLREVLANPARLAPTASYVRMPDLGLASREITSLVAFLNAEAPESRAAAARPRLP